MEAVNFRSMSGVRSVVMFSDIVSVTPAARADGFAGKAKVPERGVCGGEVPHTDSFLERE